MRWMIVPVVILGLIAWGGIVEDRAESRAKAFCDAVPAGSAFRQAAVKAKSVGEDRLRRIRKESIIIGFTGIPPFSRHFCDISRDGDSVGETRYVYLD